MDCKKTAYRTIPDNTGMSQFSEQFYWAAKTGNRQGAILLGKGQRETGQLVFQLLSLCIDLDQSINLEWPNSIKRLFDTGFTDGT